MKVLSPIKDMLFGNSIVLNTAIFLKEYVYNDFTPSGIVIFSNHLHDENANALIL